jgi:hypothetical protein
LRPFGGAAFAAADPTFGVIDDSGKLALFKAPVTGGLRGR